MLDKVLKIDGVTVLNRKEKSIVKGQSCMDDAWDYGSRMSNKLGADAYDATDWFYDTFC